jgi:glycosyltransferase involved in cell wall biosynthesis
MRLSIIIPNYNYARYVGAAIRSALDVRWRDTQTIVVDDGSTDGSRDVIAAFGDRVTAIFKENGGQNSAVNAAFERSTGDIVIVLDSDDMLSPGVAEQIASVWHAGVAKVQFGLSYINEHGELLGEVWPDYARAGPGEPPLSVLRRRAYYEAPTTSGNAWSRRFLHQVLPLPVCPPSRTPGAYYGLFFDAYLNMLAPCFGEIITLAQPQGYYRVHVANDSGSGKAITPYYTHTRCLDYARTVAKANEVLAALGKSPGFLIDCERDEMHMRYRLITRKLIPLASGDPSLLRTFTKYCRSVWLSDFDPKHKALFAAWALVTLAATPSIAQRAFDLRSSPGLRPVFLKGLMRVRRDRSPS